LNDYREIFHIIKVWQFSYVLRLIATATELHRFKNVGKVRPFWMFKVSECKHNVQPADIGARSTFHKSIRSLNHPTTFLSDLSKPPTRLNAMPVVSLHTSSMHYRSHRLGIRLSSASAKGTQRKRFVLIISRECYQF
jgi:hypothetical protein